VVTNILQSPHSNSHQSAFSHPCYEDRDSTTQHPLVRTSKEHARSSSISVTVSFPPSSSTGAAQSRPLGHGSKFPSSWFSSIPKLHLTPLQLLHLLSPLALFQCILLALYFGEHTKLLSYLSSHSLSSSGNHTSFEGSRALNETIGGVLSDVNTGVGGSAELLGSWSLAPLIPGVAGLAINACMAFALNVVSFQTNRAVGPLSMSVAGTYLRAFFSFP
jgi:hypothetical protein